MSDYNSIGIAFVIASGILGFVALVLLAGGVATSKEMQEESKQDRIQETNQKS
jgi:high-affinity Fe2+/Pb2+ permease